MMMSFITAMGRRVDEGLLRDSVSDGAIRVIGQEIWLEYRWPLSSAMASWFRGGRC